MPVTIGVLNEAHENENRVALVPEAIKSFTDLGAEIIIETGAGVRAGVPDADLAPAKIVAGADEVLANADVLLCIQPLNADHAKNVIVVKRGQGKGFSGIENELFFLDQTRMLYGDGQQVAADLIAAVKTL